MSVALGIDLGTQSIKVFFYDMEARACIALTSAPLELYQTSLGVAEQRADWWIKGLHNALQQVEPSIRSGVKVISVSGQQHGFVPIDQKGQPLVPVKLWCDTSTNQECDYLTEKLGGHSACLSDIGNPILPGYTASKLLWFRNNHPKAYADMDCILLPHDYINFYLTGEKCMEAGDASGTGFFNIRRREWSEKALTAIDPVRDLRSCLPPVTKSITTIGTLLPNIAKELGLPEGTPVATGGGDNMMGAIGTGNVAPGTITMSLGTSGTLYSYADMPVLDRFGQIAAFCSSTGGWLPLICTMNCTVATELVRDLFNADITDFESMLKASPRGAEGILTVPYFNGERTPNLPNAKACMFGMDSQNMSPQNFLRSTVEGVCFGLRAALEHLTNQGIKSDQMILTGGGANSQIWRQTMSDVCNTPVTVLKNQEAAAFGAALQAIAAMSGESIVTLTKTHLQTDNAKFCEPQPNAVDFYQNHYQTYESASAQVAEIYTVDRSQK